MIVSYLFILHGKLSSNFVYVIVTQKSYIIQKIKKGCNERKHHFLTLKKTGIID